MLPCQVNIGVTGRIDQMLPPGEYILDELENRHVSHLGIHSLQKC